MARTHQTDEAVFRSILPEDIEWKPFPGFPPEARLAVLIREPTQPGPYVIRVKVPTGVTLMPHRHPERRALSRVQIAASVDLRKTPAVRCRAFGKIDVDQGDRVETPLCVVSRIRALP